MMVKIAAVNILCDADMLIHPEFPDVQQIEKILCCI